MCARQGGVVLAVTALAHQVPGELAVLIPASVAMEQDAIMRRANVCVCRVGEEQTVHSHVLLEVLVIIAFRPVTVAIMHLVEEVMASVNANQDGWDLDVLKPVLKVPLGVNASMFATAAQKTLFAILSKVVSAAMDLKETCVTSPSLAQYSRTKTQSFPDSQPLIMLDSLWVSSLLS